MKLPEPPTPVTIYSDEVGHLDATLREYGKACAEAMRDLCIRVCDAEQRREDGYNGQLGWGASHISPAWVGDKIKELGVE